MRPLPPVVAILLFTLMVLCGCGKQAKTPAERAKQAALSKKEMAAREGQYQAGLTEDLAKKKAAANAAAAEANENHVAPGYNRALENFTLTLRSLPDVRATQLFGGDGVRVYLRSTLPDDQSKFIANTMYRRLVAVRSKYMNASKASHCTIFLKDENGDTLYTSDIFTQ